MQEGGSLREGMQTNQVVAVSNSMGETNGQDKLVIHAARYGWAKDIWGAPTGLQGGAKDVTDIVRGLVRNNELHVNPTKARQYMNQQFWPETASGPGIPRKLAVSYSYGVDGRVQTVETPAVPHEAVDLRINGNSSSDQIPAQAFQGFWGCCCLPFFFALETKRAVDVDTLVHEGRCFPLLCCPYSDTWVRDPRGGNKFVKKDKPDDVIEYGDQTGFVCFGSMGCSMRLSKCNMVDKTPMNYSEQKHEETKKRLQQQEREGASKLKETKKRLQEEERERARLAAQIESERQEFAKKEARAREQAETEKRLQEEERERARLAAQIESERQEFAKKEARAREQAETEKRLQEEERERARLAAQIESERQEFAKKEAEMREQLQGKLDEEKRELDEEKRRFEETLVAKKRGEEEKLVPDAQSVSENKYAAIRLILGSPEHSDLKECLGLDDPFEFSELLKNPLKAMRREWMAAGSENDQANFDYVCRGTVAPDEYPDHVKESLRTGVYHGGAIADGEFDTGHQGMDLKDFTNHEISRLAGLQDHHVAAIRLYTSSSYPLFNQPMRNGVKPHPIRVTMYCLSEGLLKLRKVGAKTDPEGYATTKYLWRGMKDREMDLEAFKTRGGTELAPMSTTSSREVADSYAGVGQDGHASLLFRYTTKALSRGVLIDYLSMYPKEKEFLYPPLTSLTYDDRGDVMVEGNVTIVPVDPQMA